MLLAIVEKAKNGDTAAFIEYCKITGQYETALDQKEQKAKIDKLKAEAEQIRAKTGLLTGAVDNDDGVILIMGGEDYESEHFLPSIRQVDEEESRLKSLYGDKWKEHIEPKWEKYLSER